MTVTDPRPVRERCMAGLHEMTPDNVKPHNGRRYCRACDVAARHGREARIRARMTQLFVGFAYRPTGRWQDRSACRNVSPKLFECGEKADETPTMSADMVSRDRHTVAREFCERCPVVAQCLGQALVEHDTGTRGGELITSTDWKTFRPTARKLAKELGL